MKSVPPASVGGIKKLFICCGLFDPSADADGTDLLALASCGKYPRRANCAPAALELAPAALELAPAALELAPAALELAPAALELAPTALEPAPTTLELASAPLELAPHTCERAPHKCKPAQQTRKPAPPRYGRLLCLKSLSSGLCRPRSGRNENSPALQRWDKDDGMNPSPRSGRENFSRRSLSFTSVVRFTDLRPGYGPNPSAEALGYFHIVRFCGRQATSTFWAKPGKYSCSDTRGSSAVLVRLRLM
jgi:hypothetical protein